MWVLEVQHRLARGWATNRYKLTHGEEKHSPWLRIPWGNRKIAPFFYPSKRQPFALPIWQSRHRFAYKKCASVLRHEFVAYIFLVSASNMAGGLPCGSDRDCRSRW